MILLYASASISYFAPRIRSERKTRVLCSLSIRFVYIQDARLFVDALWSPAGKELTSWFSFVMSNCDVGTFHWYHGSRVVLDSIDSLSLPSFLLFSDFVYSYESIKAKQPALIPSAR